MAGLETHQLDGENMWLVPRILAAPTCVVQDPT